MNRLLSRAEPYIPQSGSKLITFFGSLPNDHYPPPNQYDFHGASIIHDDYALGDNSFITVHTSVGDYAVEQFVKNISRLHGIGLNALAHGDRYEFIRSEIERLNIPAWPAEGSVGLIDDVIFINFGN
jgi:hypothetical protein